MVIRIPTKIKKNRGNGSINKRDWLLIIGLTIAPMTGFRIWKIGPAEVLCLIWGLKYISFGKPIKSGLSKFFLAFLTALALGSLAGYIIAPNELRIEDLLTWCYLGLISVLVYEGLSHNSLTYNEQLFFCFAQTAIIWYLFLFFYSMFVSNVFLGAPLWYSNARFSGGGTNPHQIAVLLCGLTFVFVRVILKKQNIIRSLLFTLVCVYLMVQTASSTGIMSIAIGFAIVFFFGITNLFQTQKNVVLIILIATALAMAVLGFSHFFESFMSWVSEDPNGLGRLNIYSSFPITFGKSPIIGLGPGVHGMNGYIEYHNTYIEILAATGIIGGLIFLVYSFDLFARTGKTEWQLLPIVVAMYAYGFAGFAMRRLVYWGLIAFVTVIVEQKKYQVGKENERT